MSRRDTIIIAVLVNAALLMILFATALRSDHSKEDTKKGAHKLGDSNLEMAAAQPIKKSPSSNFEEPYPDKNLSSEDLLNELVAPVPTLADKGQENIFSFEETEFALAPSQTEVVEKIETPVVVEAVTKPKTEDQYVRVTVKKGDYLERIAKSNNTSVAAIMKANNMSSTQLKIGQVLKVPGSDGKKGQQKTSSPQPAQSSATEYYIVKEGDNPWLIASRNKINLEELLRLNGLDEHKAKRLRPGDKLKIR